MAITSNLGKAVAAGALAILTLGAGITVNAGQAEARWNRGDRVAAGIAGGVLAGALIAGAAHSRPAPVYYDYTSPPRPVYRPRPEYRHHHYRPYPRPVGYYGGGYAETGYVYTGPVCRLKRVREWTPYGWTFRRVEVCR